jgi:hypothetical protein
MWVASPTCRPAVPTSGLLCLLCKRLSDRVITAPLHIAIPHGSHPRRNTSVTFSAPTRKNGWAGDPPANRGSAALLST